MSACTESRDKHVCQRRTENQKTSSKKTESLCSHEDNICYEIYSSTCSFTGHSKSNSIQYLVSLIWSMIRKACSVLF